MQKLKVLLADDHDSFRRILIAFLRAQKDVEVVGEAVDGQEAVEQAERFHPDLVLMDIHMPKQNGLEATKAIKNRWPSTRVHVDVNVNRNTNINNNINRGKYASQYPGKGQAGQGQWKHNPQHRQGVAYRDQATGQRYGQSQARTMDNKQAARGYADRGNAGSQQRTQGQNSGARAGTQERKTGTQAGTQQKNLGSQGGASQKNPGSKQGIQQSDRSAFGGSGSGKSERMSSQRGSVPVSGSSRRQLWRRW